MPLTGIVLPFTLATVLPNTCQATLRAMRWFFTVCFLATMGICAAQAGPDYDKTRYDQMETLINSSTNHLLGKSLDEVSDLLSLKGAPWDAAYTSYPSGEARIYHFRGYYLYLHLEILPKGTSPTNHLGVSFTAEELQKSGVRWLAAFYPFVDVDGLTNRAERMTNYWEAVDVGFRKRYEEMEKGETKK